MLFDLESTPRLPPEILDRIVDFADDLSTRSCLLVSRHLHTCAQRNIYRKWNVILTDNYENLNSMHQRLFKNEADSPLRAPGRYVRSLSIKFVNVFLFENPPIDEESVVPLLESFYAMPRLDTLILCGGSIFQHPRVTTDWDQVPRSVQKALLSIVGVISTLLIQDIKHFPIHSLCNNTRLQHLRIHGCSGLHTPPAVAGVAPAMTIPNLKHLSIGETLPFPRGFVLPAMRGISATSHSRANSDMVWKEIKRTCQSLERVCVFDIARRFVPDTPNCRMYPSIPADIKLDMFSSLVSLSYLYDGRAWADRPTDIPFLGDVLRCFEASKAVPRLKTIKLTLTLDGGEALNDSFWMERKDILANDSTWSSLQGILTSGLYPQLQRLEIDLKFTNSVFQELDNEVIHDIRGEEIDRGPLEREVRTLILGHLVKLRANLNSVVVKVSTDF